MSRGRRPAWVSAGSRRDRLRWWTGRRRRPLAAVCAAVAVLAALSAVRPRPAPVAPTTAVLVAAHDLAPGTALTAGDLRTERLPARLVPPSALRPGARTSGRSLAVAVPAGVPVTTAALDVGRVLPPGTVATPVRLADPGEVALLTVGDRVDVLATPTDPTGATDPATGAAADGAAADGAAADGAAADGAAADGAATDGAAAASGSAPVVVAADVPVLALPTATADSGDQGGLVVVATTSVQAAALAAAAGSERLSVTVRAS